jgi:bacterioferritin (cytochrome b1)
LYFDSIDFLSITSLVIILDIDSALKRKQDLYTLLKSQHEAEVKEMNHYMSVLSRMNNGVIRNYIHKLLDDGLRHIEYISTMMTAIEGASSSLNLTKQGIIKSIDEEKESRDLLLKCVELADDIETKSLLKSIMVDEEHHIKILEHIEELVSTSGQDH